MFSATVLHRSLVRFQWPRGQLCVGAEYRQALLAITETLFAETDPGGQVKLEMSSHTSRPLKTCVFYVAYRMLRSDDEKMIERLISQTCGLAKASFGTQALMFPLLTATLDDDKIIHSGDPFVVKSELNEPRINNENLLVFSDHYSFIEKQNELHSKYFEALELIDESSYLKQFRSAYLLRWTALEVAIGSDNVVPPLKKLYGASDGKIFRLGILHLQKLRHLFVHKGFKLEDVHEIELQDYLNMVTLDYLDTLIGLDCQSRASKAVGARWHIFESLNVKNFSSGHNLGKDSS